ncbi:MAG TPA: metallophosphoesterase [Vicinamibacteria bacterium]|nr:metallophosphoesterase [Vicinamibacteria bacterium]
MTRRVKRLALWLAPAAVLVIALVASTSGGCSGVIPRRLDPVAAFDRVETRLLILGDAGAPMQPKDPVLEAAREEAARHAEQTVVLFLGDNVYPRGLVEEKDPFRKEMERRLDAQIDVSRKSGARAIFTPGNHDWNAWSRGGWEAIRRQGEYIQEKGEGLAELLPDEGCPGPVVRDLGGRLRLVLLDTQWWLHQFEKPRHPDSQCGADSETEVLDALEDAIAEADGRFVVVAAHHPLASGGAHGGYFGWRDHIFPLRARKSWLWVPLPGLGSIYPLARRRGVSDQDMGGPLNRKMREAFEGVFSRHPPFMYAAGHDHNLQVMAGQDVRYLLVSGAGYYGHLSRTVWTRNTLFAQAASGYMTLEVDPDGRPRLGVVTVDATGKAREAWSAHLE